MLDLRPKIKPKEEDPTKRETRPFYDIGTLEASGSEIPEIAYRSKEFQVILYAVKISCAFQNAMKMILPPQTRLQSSFCVNKSFRMLAQHGINEISPRFKISVIFFFSCGRRAILLV